MIEAAESIVRPLGDGSQTSPVRNHSKTKSDTCTSSKTHQDTLDEFLRKRKQSATPPNTKETKTYRKDDGKNYPIAASDTGLWVIIMDIRPDLYPICMYYPHGLWFWLLINNV